MKGRLVSPPEAFGWLADRHGFFKSERTVNMNVHDELSPHTSLPFWVTNAENVEVVRVTPEGDVTVSPRATTEHVRWALEHVTRMLTAPRVPEVVAPPGMTTSDARVWALRAASAGTSPEFPALLTAAIRALDAWREYAGHQEWCRYCGEDGVKQCDKGRPLQEEAESTYSAFVAAELRARAVHSEQARQEVHGVAGATEPTRHMPSLESFLTLIEDYKLGNVARRVVHSDLEWLYSRAASPVPSDTSDVTDEEAEQARRIWYNGTPSMDTAWLATEGELNNMRAVLSNFASKRAQRSGHVDASVPESDDVTAWVVVRGKPGELDYFGGFNGFQDQRGKWYRNPLGALRYASKDAADIHAGYFDDARVEEHMFTDAGRAASRTPERAEP